MIVWDLDGTLTPYPGNDFRSLYTKYSSLREEKMASEEAAALSAEVMVNRLLNTEKETLILNLEKSYKRAGPMLILSRNYRLVGEEYLRWLGVIEWFNLEKSYFRDQFKEKKEVLKKLESEYDSLIYYDDDIGEVKTLTAASNGRTAINHLPRWLGDCELE